MENVKNAFRFSYDVCESKTFPILDLGVNRMTILKIHRQIFLRLTLLLSK